MHPGGGRSAQGIAVRTRRPANVRNDRTRAPASRTSESAASITAAWSWGPSYRSTANRSGPSTWKTSVGCRSDARSPQAGRTATRRGTVCDSSLCRGPNAGTAQDCRIHLQTRYDTVFADCALDCILGDKRHLMLRDGSHAALPATGPGPGCGIKPDTSRRKAVAGRRLQTLRWEHDVSGAKRGDHAGLRRAALASAACLMLLVAGCASTPPRQQGDLCAVFGQHPDWYDYARSSESRWGTPVPVLMAFVRHESSYRSDARPPREWLWFIPLGRPSSAQGYAQAQDPAWGEYTEERGSLFRSRSDMEDALDFIGWYNYKTHRQLGIRRDDAYRLYLGVSRRPRRISARDVEREARRPGHRPPGHGYRGTLPGSDLAVRNPGFVATPGIRSGLSATDWSRERRGRRPCLPEQPDRPPAAAPTATSLLHGAASHPPPTAGPRSAAARQFGDLVQR